VGSIRGARAQGGQRRGDNAKKPTWRFTAPAHLAVAAPTAPLKVRRSSGRVGAPPSPRHVERARGTDALGARFRAARARSKPPAPNAACTSAGTTCTVPAASSGATASSSKMTRTSTACGAGTAARARGVGGGPGCEKGVVPSRSHLAHQLAGGERGGDGGEQRQLVGARAHHQRAVGEAASVGVPGAERRAAADARARAAHRHRQHRRRRVGELGDGAAGGERRRGDGDDDDDGGRRHGRFRRGGWR